MKLPLCRAAYGAVNASVRADRPLRGAMFWEWQPIGQPQGDRAINSNDTAFQCAVTSLRSEPMDAEQTVA